MSPTPDVQHAVPLQSGREYDLPGGPSLGHAAALRVHCSEGPASFHLGRNTEPNNVLMAAVSRIEPAKQMEGGTSHDAATGSRLRKLSTPLLPADLAAANAP